MDRICDDALHEFLFKHEGTNLVNLKLLRGDSPDVSREQIREQLHSALVQKAAGQSHTVRDFPDAEGSEPINLSELEKLI